MNYWHAYRGRVLVCLLLVAAPSAGAITSPSLKSVIATEGVRNSSEFHIAPQLNATDTRQLSVNTSYTYNGFVNNQKTGNYDPAGPMTFGIIATAQSNYGDIHASCDTSVVNAFYDDSPSNDGVPDTFVPQSNAEFVDTLTVTGAPNLSSISLVFNLEGNITSSGAGHFGAGYAALWQNYPDLGGNAYMPNGQITDNSGNVSRTVTSAPFPLTNGQTTVDILLQAATDLDTRYITPGGTASSIIDFSDTAQMLGVEGFDSNGNAVSIDSVVGQSGTTYPTTVPEPLSLGVLGIGGLVIRPRRHRRQLSR